MSATPLALMLGLTIGGIGGFLAGMLLIFHDFGQVIDAGRRSLAGTIPSAVPRGGKGGGGCGEHPAAASGVAA